MADPSCANDEKIIPSCVFHQKMVQEHDSNIITMNMFVMQNEKHK